MGTSIPLWLLRDLKCRHCTSFLSCGPVYATPDCGLLCGRCKAIAKPNFRNYVYEELASIFKFPCLNWANNCPEEGPWNALKDHEMDCPYRGSCGLLCVDPVAFFSSKRVLPNEEGLLYLEVPEKCLNLVCCKNCGKYLSCEPVHINVVGSNICHRCYLSNGVPPHTLRNLAYEKLANIFRFPCIFRAKGCPIKFKFGRDSWEHEVNCHYKDVQIPTTPPTPDVKIHRTSEFENSGYRLSYEGNPSSMLRNSSFHNEKLPFELPRVGSILNDQVIAEEIRKGELKSQLEDQTSRQNGSRKMQPSTKHPTKQDITCSCSAKEPQGCYSDKDRLPDKERGIVSTHSGHVYATLTRSSVLFAPPQMQRNTDPSNGLKVTREFQDKVRRNASNASQSEFVRHDKMRNSNESDSRYSELLSDTNNELNHSTDTSSFHSFDFPALNKNQSRNMDRSDGEFSPMVKEYVQYNPQNKVQRNESMTIGNADLIAELKLRNEQRKKNRQQDESSKDIEVH